MALEQRHILLVDDDARLRGLVKRYLNERGLLVTVVASGQEALSVLQIFQPNAMILDIMLPGMDGFTLARRVDHGLSLPIVMLSALGEIKHRIEGLKCGAVDYLTKPFDPEELYLRLQVAMREPRQKKGDNDFADHHRIDLRTQEGEHILLTDHEERLYKIFLARPGIVLSRAALVHMCQSLGGDRSIDVLVLRLRRKLQTLPHPTPMIKTVRQQGYVFLHGN